MKEFIDFVHGVQIATKALQLYSPEHPRSSEALRHLVGLSGILLGYADRAQVVTSHGRIFVNGKPLEDKSLATTALSRQLAEREINGIVLYRGVTEQELGVLVKALSMKPQRLEQLGGMQQHLSSAGVVHVRVSHVRYEELGDSEKVVDATRLAELNAIAEASGVTIDSAQLPALFAAAFAPLMQGRASVSDTQASSSEPGDALDPRSVQALDLAATEKALSAAGSLRAPEIQSLLTSTVESMTPEAQSRLLASKEGLPPGPLREFLDAAAPGIVMNIIQALVGQKMAPSGELPDIVQHLLTHVPAADRSLVMLRDRLIAMGLDRDEIEELVHTLTWEQLELDEKMQRVMDGRKIFDLPADRLQRFLRELLVQQRHDDFVKVTDRFGTGLTAGTPEQRGNVSQSFIRIARMGRQPGLNPAEENIILRLLLNHFLHEPDKELQQTANDALSTFIGTWIGSGRSDKAIRALTNLEAAVSAVATQLPWKKQAYDSFLSQLARDHIDEVTALLFEKDHETLSTEVFPVLTFLGAPAAAELMDRLASEDDRARRGRLVRAVKAIGRPALIPLRHALSSPTWYLVRNALNLLGDLSATDLVDEVGGALSHSDTRVGRTAARALSKIGGPRAAALLAAAIPRADSEMLTEILFSLGALRAESAVESIAELTRPRRGEDAIREKAIEALGQIGSPKAVPALEEILRKKGLLSAGESVEIRVAAARSLALINTAEARLAIRKAVEAESNSQAREQLARLLDAPPPRETP